MFISIHWKGLTTKTQNHHPFWGKLGSVTLDSDKAPTNILITCPLSEDFFLLKDLATRREELASGYLEELKARYHDVWTTGIQQT